MDKIGGTTISFKYLIDALNKDPDIKVSVLTVDGIREGGWRSFHRFIRLILLMALFAKNNDIVSLHANVTAVPYIGPFVLLVCRILRKPLTYRMFAGIDHNGLKGLSKTIARWFIRNVDLYMAQTQLLVASAIKEGFANVKWFPTCRPVAAGCSFERKQCRRFVFVGQLRPEKGLKELAEAAEKLPDGIEVHVWGPWFGLSKDFFEKYTRIKLMGKLKPEEVASKLLEYDASVLPTYLDEEGYSGIIFESYAMGLPVIATRWLALPEIVIDRKTGLLVEPHDSDSLLKSMILLSSDHELYHRLRLGAYEFVQNYSTSSQARRFTDYCKEILALRG